jgi:molecular chaperone GrpE
MTDSYAPDDSAAPGQEERTSTEATPEQIASLVAALTKESAEYKDKLLRTLAEMENLRRRTEREVSDARSYGISGFARDALGVADNLRRALEAIGPELRASVDAGTKALIEGVELIERDLLKALEKNGVRRFDPLGERFDPNLHQAMYEVPDPSVPAGSVVQVVQPGFMIGERILRPALVAVAKGGPKAPPAQPAEESAADDGQAPGGDSDFR